MLDMTLMSLDEVEDFISVFLGEELVGKPTPPKIETFEEGEGRRGRSGGRGRNNNTSSSRSSIEENREIPEDEIPLENVEAAKKLGSVDLDGKDDETPQRRRRRRGGRGRGGRSSSEGEQNEENTGEESTSEESSKAKLVDPLPFTKFAKEVDGEEISETTAPAEAGEAEVESSIEEEAAAKKKKTKRQPKRRGRPKAEKPEAEVSTDEDSAEDAKAEEPELVAEEVAPEPEKPAAQEVKSASGTTIAPGLAAMMAGGAKTKTDDN
jgi:ribonuclease E